MQPGGGLHEGSGEAVSRGQLSSPLGGRGATDWIRLGKLQEKQVRLEPVRRACETFFSSKFPLLV